MRVVALEEHFTVPAVVQRIDKGAIARRGYVARKPPTGRPSPMERAAEIGPVRLKSMDDTGITVQVLSNTGPGPDLVPGPDGVAMAREVNDYLAGAMAKHPTRFAGFATLPMASPEACAAELKRTVKDLKFVGALVNGTTDGRFLDHPSYDGLLAAAAELDVPIYIHPHLPPEPVRQAYYSDLPGHFGTDAVDGTAGWGWHSEIVDPRAAHGAERRARQASQAQDHHRPHGRDAAGDAGPHRRCCRIRSRRLLSRAAKQATFSIRSGSPPAASSASRRSSPRCRRSASTASCSRSTTRIAADAWGRKFLDEVALSPVDMAKLSPWQRRCVAEAEGVAGAANALHPSLEGEGEARTWQVWKNGYLKNAR